MIIIRLRIYIAVLFKWSVAPEFFDTQIKLARAGTYLYIPKSVFQITDILYDANDRMEKTLCSRCQIGNGRNFL